MRNPTRNAALVRIGDPEDVAALEVTPSSKKN